MHDIKLFKEFFEKERETFINDYFTFLRFKSIATDPEFHSEVLACAHWLSRYLKGCGLQVETWETGSAPVLFAHDLRAGTTKKTLLLYCHYDVQPVDPLEEWISPPFEPTVRKGEVYARGACDNKGQCFYTAAALKALLKLVGHLPVNLKFIIEGEEESGSRGLERILKQKQETLKADYLLIVDSGIENKDSPAITLGGRGIVCFQITVKEATFDLHSGMTGGIAYNPNRALVEALAALHDEKGKVAIPGFYDEVSELTEEEKKEIAFDFDAEEFQGIFGFKPSHIEKGFSAREASWLRPTAEINGIWGGYTGPGFKTVIPAKAYAKLSCRLVPNQNPEVIATLVKKFIEKKVPQGLQVDVEVLPGNGRGFRTNPHSPLAELMTKSYSQIFEKPCKKILIGGSIPIAVDLAAAAGAEMVLVGLALPDDRFHAPNEHFGLDRLEKGFLTICRAIELFS